MCVCVCMCVGMCVRVGVVLDEHVGHTVKETTLEVGVGVVNDNRVNMLRVCVRSDSFSQSIRRIFLLHALYIFHQYILKINECVTI